MIKKNISNSVTDDSPDLNGGLNVIVREVLDLAAAIAAGRLDARIDAAQFTGEAEQMAQGINATLDAIIAPLNIMAEYIDRLAHGDIPAKIVDAYNGDFNEFKNNVNRCIDTVTELVAETTGMAQAAASGNLDKRVDVRKYDGDWAVIVNGLNDTADAMVTPLRDIGQTLDRLAAGDLKARVTAAYEGDYNILKVACNELGGQLQGVQNVLENLKNAAVNGQLDARGNPQQFKGDIAGLVHGLNAVLDAVIAPLNVTAEYLERLAKGDLPAKITEAYRGDFNEIKNNLNLLIDALNDVTQLAEALSVGNLDFALQERSSDDKLIRALNSMKTSIGDVIKEMYGLIQKAQDGKLDARGNAAAFGGAWRDLIASINAMIDAFIAPLNVMAEYVDRIGHGDIPQKITEAYKGDFNEVKNNLNHCIDAMNGLVDETIMLTNAAVEGRLDVRGDARKFGGDYGKIIQGLNNTLNAIIAPLNVTAEYVERISRGDLPERITEAYRGDFNEVKNNLNLLLDSMNEVTALAQTVANGNLKVVIEKRSKRDPLMEALQTMVRYLQDIAGVAENIAEGDLRVSMKPRSTDDALSQSLQKMVTYIQDVADAVQQLAKGDVQLAIRPRSDRDALNRALLETVAYLKEMAGFAEKLAVGEVQFEVRPRSDRDQLSYAFGKSVEYLRDVTNVAQKLAVGEIQVSITPRSERDVLNRAFVQTIQYLQDAAGIAEKISNKNLTVVVAIKSEQDVLNHAIQRMVENIRAMMAEIEKTVAEVQQQNWQRTGQADLNNAMRGEQDVATLAKNVITYLAKYLKAQVGTFYMADEIDGQTSLRLAGSYAYNKRKGTQSAFALGEGLIGQAAVERETLLFSEVPPDYMLISSSLGNTGPRHILVTPFVYEGALKGVLELGTAHAFTDLELEFLNQARESIAIAFNTAQSRLKMQALLEATQQQAEELQQQQEELRVSNEELESQTSALKESEARLQQQQEELRQTNEELGEQTKALEKQQKDMQDKNLALAETQRQVEQKARELEISSKYKSEFLSNMSHELRTPLNSLLILSNLLQENKDANLTEKQVEFAKTIHTSGSELLTLINEVLDLSKIEAGKMELTLEEMPLTGLAGYVQQHFTHVAETKGLTLQVNVTPGLPPTLHTDRQRVEQVVKNLLSNAFKFTERGGVTVTLARPAAGVNLSRSGLPPTRAVGITISDTGVGIPLSKQQVIFEAFQQADGSTNRKYGGTGLGLSISRELAKLLGGEIQIASAEGQGSAFTLYLPERTNAPRPDAGGSPTVVPFVPASPAYSAAPVSAPPTAPFIPAAPAQGDGLSAIRDDREILVPKAKSLLIIEDDVNFARILLDLARVKGFHGLVAADGAAGLQLAYQYLPSAIILDIGLPGMDGWMVMEKLKANPDTRHIPVHFMSSQDKPTEAMQMGAIGYLTKPVSMADLNAAFTTIETSLTAAIKRVLIVEDDPAAQKSIVALLQGNDVEITAVGTGVEALGQLHAAKFDCLVLDLGLTDISGFDLLDQIKADSAIAPLPIIVYTGKDLSKQDEARLNKHAESTIIKGVKSQERLVDEVTLFLRRIEADLPEEQRQKLRMQHDREAVFNGKTVLLVDDDMRNVYALANVLDGKGLHILIAENGKQALQHLASHPEINLVLMDIMMPEMDGYETTRRIRQLPTFHKLPVIALTAKAMKGDRQKCLEAGANDYLSKPIDTAKLLSLLRVWLY